MVNHARGFFQISVDSHPNSSEAVACLGYALHRTGEEEAALYWFRPALDLDPAHSEARIYLGNLLYDRGEYEAALLHFERTEPGDHLDELAVWRLMELKKSAYNLAPTDPELAPWSNRLAGIGEGLDSLELMLAEIEAAQPDGTFRDPRQLELFGTLLVELQGMQRRGSGEKHRVKTKSGVAYSGTWEEIVLQMKMDDRELSEASVKQYMARATMRNRSKTGVVTPVKDAENFIRRSAAAGVLIIIS
jgi:tetratricopeptide (TPR) repeat protein